MPLRPYQQDAHDKIIEWIRRITEPCMIEAATGCHERGHPILLADGRIIPVEEVDVGDRLIGPDGNIRTVVRLHRGFDKMYRIFPKKGEPFRVNAGHIFSLKMSPAKHGDKHRLVEMTIDQILKATPCARHRAKLYRSESIEFDGAKSILPIHPWILGVIIGDGSIKVGTPMVCTPDQEIIHELYSFSKEFGLEVRFKNYDRSAQNYRLVDPGASRSTRNKLTSALDELGIFGCGAGEKFVPDIYKRSSVLVRLQLIAGLLDTDGYMTHNGYDWISKSEKLAADMVFMCRSVGLAAYKTKCKKGYSPSFCEEYFRVSISGNTQIIPIRVERKKAKPRKQVKDWRVTGFTYLPDGMDEYFGFEVDGDHLYLDGYFMAHHNSGKSHIIAALADTVLEISGKRVLVLAPSKELVEQNHEKYVATGNPASIFSASAGMKCLEHPVVFGTPLTVLNSIEKFGNEFAMVILDECHNITPTFKDIVEKIPNPNLRVVGMSATPFRMGSGYVFKQWPDGGEAGTNGYFTRCVYRITAPELISQGFLTPPIIGKPDAESYATKGMQLNSMGQFRKDDVDRAYHGHGRKTSAIVADIVAKSEDRRGVLIFAATVAHAHECLASLPPELSAIVTAKTTKREREDILRRFKAQELKYLVNVAVLTTGFDATHVDVIAVLRATESVGLLMQIIGRGLRLHPGKENCLIVDYAENIERHCPNGDLFDPLVKEKEASEGVKIKVECPLCSVDNWFSARVNLSGYKVNKPGYFIDLDGNPIMGPHGPIPAHYGRRCTAVHLVGNELHRCPYRWTEKECPHCEHKNDIAARYCEECKIELVDPNAKLVTFNNKKKDPTQVQCDEVEGWTVNSSISQSGNPMWRINVATPYRSFQIYVQKMPTFSKAIAAKRLFDSLGGGRPKTIKYRKNPSTNYFEVISFNEKPDEAPRGH